jgi:hypothetical protein
MCIMAEAAKGASKKTLYYLEYRMDSVDHYRMCEDAAFGEWLIKVIADNIGSEPDQKSIDRAIYKETDCGAWVRFDDKGIMVGTIVEGSDAEYSERIELSDQEDELCKRFWDAIQRCQDFANEHFEGV